MMLVHQMGMHVHQARHYRVLAQINQRISLFGFDVASNDIDEFSCFDDDGYFLLDVVITTIN